VLWIAVIAIPHLVADDMNAATRRCLFSCSFVVIIIAVIRWGYQRLARDCQGWIREMGNEKQR
jgi:hypothetical protein